MAVISEEINTIFHKPSSSLSCHVDLPRFMPHITVYNYNSLTANINSPLLDYMDTTTVKHIKEFLLITAYKLFPDDDTWNKIINSKFSEYFTEATTSETLDVTIKKFISEVLEDSKLSRLLKTMTQSVVAPIVIHMKENIGDIYPHNSLKGGWSILAEIREKFVTVTHTKEEITLPTNEDQFYFKWDTCFTFDSEIKHLHKVEVELSTLSHFGFASESRRKLVNSLFSKLFNESSPEDKQQRRAQEEKAVLMP